MMIKELSLCWITTSDLKKAKDFFGQTLGLRFVAKESNEAMGWYEFEGHKGGMKLGVGKATPENSVKPGHNAIPTFLVDDIKKAKEHLISKKVTLLGDIMEVPGHVKLLFFTDFDGNKFQLAQMLH